MALGQRLLRWVAVGCLRTHRVGLVVGLILCFTPIANPTTAGAASTCEVMPAAAPMAGVPGEFHGITPRRVADSRLTLATDGRLVPGCAVGVDIGASGAVPAQARAVAVNVTIVDADRPGYLVVFPCGTPVPATSNLNVQVGAAVPNLVVVSLPESRRICLLADQPTHAIVDVTGWFGSDGAGFVPGGTTTTVEPARLLDTRGTLRPDGGTGRWPATTELQIQVGPTQPGDPAWEAVAANITVTDPAADGYVVAYPCNQPVPPTSTVNFVRGAIRANQTLVALDRTGRLCLWSSVDAHLIVDVVGRFVHGAGDPLALGTAQRVVDSRNRIGGWTAPFTTGQVRPVDSSGGSASTAGVALLNVVATAVTAPGYLTFYRCGGPVPPTSSINFAPGDDSTNLVTVAADTCVTGVGAAQVVIDRLGWFGRPGGLSDLSVGAAGAMQPPFVPDGHDYSVPCKAGTNDIPIKLTAAPGRTAAIAGAPAAASITGMLHLQAGQLTSVMVNGPGGSSETYSVRCLPADFPPIVASVPGSPAPGWYLTTLGYITPNVGKYAVILDEHGAVVWYRKTTQPIIDLKRMRSGDLVWTNLDGFAPFGVTASRGYEQHRLDGSLVTIHRAVGSFTDHHDFRELPNGHVLLLSYVPRAGVDLTVFGAGYSASDRVVDAEIQEIDPTLPPGSPPVWTWNSKDHFNTDETTFPQRFDTDGNGVNETVDLLHINSIEPQPNGDIVASFRHLDAVARISRDTGNILWKLGGTPTTHDSSVGAKVLTIVDDPRGGPARQHSATMLPNGHLMVFDNRTPSLFAPLVLIGPARAAEYAVDLDTNTARMVWHLDDAAGRNAFGLGSVQRLTDGDTLINWGPLQPVIVEYDPANTVQLQIAQPTGGIGYRVVKEPPTSFDRAALRASAG